MENRGEITSFIFSYTSQNPSVATAQNGKKIFYSEDMEYKIR